MAKTKESRARDRVHKHLPPRSLRGPHWRQSMSGTGTGGTPDHYYEGPAGELWIEWKWTDSKYPRTLPEPTDLQQDWLKRKHNNRGRVAVIEGSPVGFRVYAGISWVEGEVATPCRPEYVARWIMNMLGLGNEK